MCGKMGRFLFRSLQIVIVIQVLTSTVLCTEDKCKENPETDARVKGKCGIITKDETFSFCRDFVVDVERYFQDCVRAVCRCDSDYSSCADTAIDAFRTICRSCSEWFNATCTSGECVARKDCQCRQKNQTHSANKTIDISHKSCDCGNHTINCTENLKDKQCESSETLCKDKTQCINKTSVCDKKNDCRDKSDEQDCADPCLPNPCQHGGKFDIDLSNMTFRCNCTEIWSGEYCETPKESVEDLN